MSICAASCCGQASVRRGPGSCSSFDERRIEVFRTSIADFDRLKPQFGEIPPDYLQARGVHLQWGSPAELAQLIAQLRAANPAVRIVCEPALAHLAGALDANRPVLMQVDLFSPDRDEARALTGTDDIARIFDCLLDAGARMVALRMGAAGSLVGTAAGEFYRVPAVPPTAVVDVTGAGNAYCGGFIAGLGRGDEPGWAAARAAASASFAIEQIGVPRFDDEKLAEAERRLAWALARIEISRDVATFLPIEGAPISLVRRDVRRCRRASPMPSSNLDNPPCLGTFSCWCFGCSGGAWACCSRPICSGWA